LPAAIDHQSRLRQSLAAAAVGIKAKAAARVTASAAAPKPTSNVFRLIAQLLALAGLRTMLDAAAVSQGREASICLDGGARGNTVTQASCS
jgi:hypothetical protein